MNTPKNVVVIDNKGESRTGLERRQFSYTAYIRERRSGKDRRKSIERKRTINSVYGKDVRRNQTNDDL